MGQACERDAHNCVIEGMPLHWASPCIQYTVQRDGSPKAGIDAAALQQEAEQAFAAWEGVQCPGGGSPRFHAQYQGPVSCQRLEAVCGGASKNDNVLMFHDQGWPYGVGVIGLTTPTGGESSGLVVDTDLELNSRDFDFSANASGPGSVKFGDVLAHEIGHFLGLAHSDVEGALMSSGYGGLQLSQELLTADDIAAICAVFPPGAPLQCPAAAMPAYDQCQLQPGEVPMCQMTTMTHQDGGGGGCSVSDAAPKRGAWSWSALGVGLLLLRRGKP